MPRDMLYSEEMNRIAERHFAAKASWQKRTISVLIRGKIPQEMHYFYNAGKNAVVIPAPLAVKPIIAGDSFEPSYEEMVAGIRADLIDNNNFSISTSLLGKGAGERHYVAFHQDREGKMVMLDSKVSEPHRFLSSADKPNLLEKAWGYLTAPFRFLSYKLGFTAKVNSQFLSNDIEVHRLGTQPILDRVSCGYHSSGAVLAMSDAIDSNENISAASIVVTIRTVKGLDVVADTLFQQVNTRPPAVSAGLSAMTSDTGERSYLQPVAQMAHYRSPLASAVLVMADSQATPAATLH